MKARSRHAASSRATVPRAPGLALLAALAASAALLNACAESTTVIRSRPAPCDTCQAPRAASPAPTAPWDSQAGGSALVFDTPPARAARPDRIRYDANRAEYGRLDATVLAPEGGSDLYPGYGTRYIGPGYSIFFRRLDRDIEIHPYHHVYRRLYSPYYWGAPFPQP